MPARISLPFVRTLAMRVSKAEERYVNVELSVCGPANFIDDRSFAHFQRVSAAQHAPARAALERAVEQMPHYADAWAMLSLIYKEEFTHRFNVLPDPLGFNRSFDGGGYFGAPCSGPLRDSSSSREAWV